MTFWDFADKHPYVLVILTFFAVLGIDSIATNVASAAARRK